MVTESKKKKKEVRIPTQERGIHTRNRIVEGAARLFAENGYYNTNSIKIAKEAGVPVGSFYTYFRDKKSPLFGDPEQPQYLRGKESPRRCDDR